MGKVYPNTEELMNGGIKKGTLNVMTASTNPQQYQLNRRQFLLDSVCRKWLEGIICDEELLLVVQSLYRNYPCPNTPIFD